jgi:hypothetical protein
MRKITITLGTLALGVALASFSAFAQEVWQTYPGTIATPAFGPGVAKGNQPAAKPLNATPFEKMYNYMPNEQAPPAQALPEVWQTYPGTISTPAFGPGVHK